MLSEIECFVNWVHWRSPGARTYRDYGYDLRKFASIVGDIAPAEVSCQDIDHFIMNQSDKGLKPTTINRRLGAIRGFYDFLSSEGQNLDCPVIPRRHHLREPQRLPRPVREEDLRRFFTAIHSRRDRVIFLLMLRCGLRISETACLSVSDIYLTQPYPHLLVHPVCSSFLL
jgi:site-specific recombinase XerD